MHVCLYVVVTSDDDRFRALGNARRRRLLRLVRDEPMAVGSLADELRMTQPAVSQHLAVLRDAGLVTVERDGRRRLYRADRAALAETRQFFDDYWGAAADRLAAAAAGRAAERRSAS